MKWPYAARVNSSHTFTCPAYAETDSTGTEGTDAVAKGLGPRIYIGGVSTAISQTMIRNHMSQFGKVTA